jgi:hypothetical protein
MKKLKRVIIANTTTIASPERKLNANSRKEGMNIKTMNWKSSLI